MRLRRLAWRWRRLHRRGGHWPARWCLGLSRRFWTLQMWRLLLQALLWLRLWWLRLWWLRRYLLDMDARLGVGLHLLG